MRSLLFAILFLSGMIRLQAQSPHGPDLKVNCGDCHSAFSWEIEVGRDTAFFDHNQTAFPLAGQHAWVDCRDCHQSLVFPEASPECISCHTDMHRTTAGSDCARCHTSENWLVDNITELHYDNGFPLMGAHAALSCDECHLSESGLEFYRIGNDCMNCHLDDFNATTEPNHRDANFSTDCTQCHTIDGFDWSSQFINHDFFPLSKGHEISDCTQCHTGGSFSNTPTDCVACHQSDYDSALNPNHQEANFPVSCTDCHTTDVGWMPAAYTQHDPLFPIFSGKHRGEWNDCVDCHISPGNFMVFSCIDCHEHNNPSALANKHDEVANYRFESNACYDCHPRGEE
ncbi:MAG: hypothetical protein KDD01_09710 [Phaeodactylibacter sp.]|nr:hypothetical protein [Phaeodactylibacter sp.]